MLFAKYRYYQDDEIKEGETGGALSGHRKNEKFLQHFGR
jgi:hypothetical protein